MIALKELLVCDDLQVLVKKFEETMTKAYDKPAPITVKKVINRPRKLWFNQELREQKCKVRRRETIFCRYRERVTSGHHQMLMEIKGGGFLLLKKDFW